MAVHRARRVVTSSEVIALEVMAADFHMRREEEKVKVKETKEKVTKEKVKVRQKIGRARIQPVAAASLPPKASASNAIPRKMAPKARARARYRPPRSTRRSCGSVPGRRLGCN